MKEGSIDAEIVKCLFIGTAGAGKTSTIYLLFGWDPPLRHSTGCIEPIRAISCIKVGSDGKIWTIVDPQKLRSLLADDIFSTFRESIASSPAASDETSTVGTDQNLPSKRSPSPEQPVSQTGAAVARQMHECMNGGDGGKLRNMKWLYLIDSGGQSQFHQLLPAFLKDTSAGVFVINLSEELSDHPLMELYDNGTKCGDSYRSPLTNEEVFRSCIQTVQSLRYTTGEGKVPNTFIIGTHQDKETPGTRARKNEQLLRILLPTEDSKESSFHDNLLFSDFSKKEVIYGVDATSREKPNTDIAREIRSKIENLAPRVKRIPHRWYGLELEIEKFAADKNRKVVTLKECLEIGKALCFPSEEAVKAALVHLDDLNIFLYYPKVLPDLVFTSPCVLLDRVRELVQKSYELKGHYSSDKPHAEGMWSHLCDRGIVTFDILERFPSHDRDCEYFSSQQLVQLFKHLLIIAPISETEFFMPALLDLLKTDQMNRPSAEHASAFIINFRGGYAPCGLCSALVACLRSSWKFATSCRKFYGNCITFSMLPQFPALVTLLDIGSYFEVYIVINAPPSLCTSVCKSACPTIRRKIVDSLKQAITARNFQNVEYDEAILCRCKKANSTPHAATVQIKTPPYWSNCTYDHSVSAELGAKELVWFPEAAPAEPSLSSQSQFTCSLHDVCCVVVVFLQVCIV